MDRQVNPSSRENQRLLPSDPSESPSTDSQEDHNGDSRLANGTTIRDSKLKLVATSINFWITGVAVAALGVFIPDIEKFYGIDDATAAFMFPAGLLGYLAATVMVEPIRSRLGLRGIAVVSPLLRLLAALFIVPGPAFPVLLVSNAVFGLGSGLADTAWNAWASCISRPNIAQGLLHGSFSLGCIVGPVVAVAVLDNHPWHMFYLVVVALACVELLIQGWAFRLDVAPKQSVAILTTPDTLIGPNALRARAVWICALFFFLYQGAEAVFTDWIVVYMRRVRHIDSTIAGLSSSIFWTGMALGRYGLGSVSDRFGVSVSVTLYILIAIPLQMGLGIAKTTPAALALLALNGFMIAPLYPSGVVVLVSRLPPRSQLTAVAVAMGLGQMGAAVAPLGVGFMATKLGVEHMVEVEVGLSVLMLLSWIGFIQFT